MNSRSIDTMRSLFMTCQDLLGSSIQHHSREHEMVYQFHDQCRIVINLVPVVKDLHRLSSQELKKLIREPESNTIQWTTKEGSAKQAIDLVSFVKDLHSLSSQEPESNTIQWTTKEGSAKQAIDLVSFVKDLHSLSSQELRKLIRETESNTIQWTTKGGSSKQGCTGSHTR